jgi:hypothetical protein
LGQTDFRSKHGRDPDLLKQIPQQLELLDSCQANQGSGISQ